MPPVLAPPAEPLAAIADAFDRSEALTPRAERRAQRRHGRQPDDPGRTLGLVWTTLLAHPLDDGWCDRAGELLEPLQAPAWLPWRELTRIEILARCPGDAWPDADAARGRLAEADWDGALAAVASLSGPRGDRLHAGMLEARAAHWFGAGEHEHAVSDLREAIAIASTPDRRLRLGLSLMPLGDEEQARAQLTVGLVLGSTQPVLTDRARMALSVLGEPEDGHPEALVEQAEGPEIDIRNGQPPIGD